MAYIHSRSVSRSAGRPCPPVLKNVQQGPRRRADHFTLLPILAVVYGVLRVVHAHLPRVLREPAVVPVLKPQRRLRAHERLFTPAGRMRSPTARPNGQTRVTSNRSPSRASRHRTCDRVRINQTSRVLPASMKRLFEQVRANKRTTRGRMELVRANKRTTRGRMDLPGGRVVESNHRRVGVNLLPVLLLQQVTAGPHHRARVEPRLGVEVPAAARDVRHRRRGHSRLGKLGEAHVGDGFDAPVGEVGVRGAVGVPAV